jgi:replication initiator protein RepSA
MVLPSWIAWPGGLPCPSLDDGGSGRCARWGEQLDVRNISREKQAGELSAEQVAGYIAKYATKATESFGSGLDQRLTATDDLDHLDQLPAHVAKLVKAAWELGGRPELDRLRLRAWAHMLGFGGHWSTKSRRYSTTFTAQRRARVAFAKRRRAATAYRWMPGAGPRRTRPWSSLPPGCSLALVTRPRASGGLPCRPPPALANSDGSPGRN